MLVVLRPHPRLDLVRARHELGYNMKLTRLSSSCIGPPFPHRLYFRSRIKHNASRSGSLSSHSTLAYYFRAHALAVTVDTASTRRL
jgi:hypothetical protein